MIYGEHSCSLTKRDFLFLVDAVKDNSDLKNATIVLVILDIVVFALGLILTTFSDLFGVLLLILMVVTGMVLSEYVRRQNNGEEDTDNYPEW